MIAAKGDPFETRRGWHKEMVYDLAGVGSAIDIVSEHDEELPAIRRRRVVENSRFGIEQGRVTAMDIADGIDDGVVCLIAERQSGSLPGGAARPHSEQFVQ